MKTTAGLCEGSKTQKLQSSDLFGSWCHADTRHQNTPVTYANIFFPNYPSPVHLHSAPTHCLRKMREQERTRLFTESVKQENVMSAFCLPKIGKLLYFVLLLGNRNTEKPLRECPNEKLENNNLWI